MTNSTKRIGNHNTITTLGLNQDLGLYVESTVKTYGHYLEPRHDACY